MLGRGGQRQRQRQRQSRKTKTRQRKPHDSRTGQLQRAEPMSRLFLQSDLFYDRHPVGTLLTGARSCTICTAVPAPACSALHTTNPMEGQTQLPPGRRAVGGQTDAREVQAKGVEVLVTLDLMPSDQCWQLVSEQVELPAPSLWRWIAWPACAPVSLVVCGVVACEDRYTCVI